MAAPYATAEDARAYESALSAPSTYSDEYLTGLIAEFEAIAEEYMGVAYAEREAVETIVARSRPGRIVLDHWPVVEVSSITINGTETELGPQIQTDLATGVVTFVNLPRSSWNFGDGFYDQTLVITYTYGKGAPPAMLKRACLEYVRSVALLRNSGVSRDIVYQSVDGMTTRYSPSPSRASGTPTGYRSVDSVLQMLFERAPAVG